jgi:hypothetical protein
MTLLWLLVAASAACDGRVTSAPHTKTRVSFELEWRHQRRGEETRWQLTCVGDGWVHVKTHYERAGDFGDMEGNFSVPPTYLQAIRQAVDKQRFFEIRGPFSPGEAEDWRPMTVIDLRLTIDGETLRMHARDPQKAMRPDEYQRFQAVFASIVGPLPTGPREEH